MSWMVKDVYVMAIEMKEYTCTNPFCLHVGDGRGIYEIPCPWCGSHNCSGCEDIDEDEDEDYDD